MSITTKIADKISSELGYDEEKSEIIAYGLFAVLQIIASLALVAIFGLIFGVLLQALVASFAASILRQYSGGVHASKPSICLVIGTVATMVIALAAHYMAPLIPTGINIIIEVFIFLYAYFIIYKKAPVDSEAKPITSEIRRKKMKYLSFSVLSLYLLFIIIFEVSYHKTAAIKFIEYSVCIYLAVLWQIFNLTTIGHKVLGKTDNFLNSALTKFKGENNNEKN